MRRMWQEEIYSWDPDGSVGKEFTCIAGDTGLILELGRSPGEGNSNPLQCSCLTGWATIHGVTKSQTCLSNTFTFKQREVVVLKSLYCNLFGKRKPDGYQNKCGRRESGKIGFCHITKALWCQINHSWGRNIIGGFWVGVCHALHLAQMVKNLPSMWKT